jgi:hypothetical protein
MRLNGGTDTNWPQHSLALFRVKLITSGKMWYINPSGSQFGLDKPILTAAEFDLAIETTIRVIHFGTPRKWFEVVAQSQGFLPRHLRNGLEALRFIAPAMSKCANESGTGVSKIAKMDAMDFEKWERKLLDAMVGPIRNYVSDFDEKGFFEAG